VYGLKHQKEKHSMDHSAGLDVSVKATSVCIVDDTGLGLPQEFVEFLQSQVQRAGPHNAISRLVKTRRFVHIADYSADQAYLEGDPVAVAGVELGGIRALLVVPMLKESPNTTNMLRKSTPTSTTKQDLIASFACV
jgi:hypothetical protein